MHIQKMASQNEVWAETLSQVRTVQYSTIWGLFSRKRFLTFFKLQTNLRMTANTFGESSTQYCQVRQMVEEYLETRRNSNALAATIAVQLHETGHDDLLAQLERLQLS